MSRRKNKTAKNKRAWGKGGGTARAAQRKEQGGNEVGCSNEQAERQGSTNGNNRPEKTTTKMIG
jgi:hypothetical protein